MPPRLRRVAIAAATVLVGAAPVLAQSGSPVTPPPADRTVDLHVDSGPLTNRSSRPGTIFSTVVYAPKTSWVRPSLHGTVLTGRATLRLTGLRDGAVQTLDGPRLAQWQGESAYFNGDAVLVELIADPGDAPSRLVIDAAAVGEARPEFPQSICGLNDDRELSSDPRLGRTSPTGCTAFLIDDPNHCFLTAGHCFADGTVNVVMFNVPLSKAGGNLNFPGPEDQYVVDPASVQFSPVPVDGDDWAYFGCFPNSQTGLTPFQAQGAALALAPATPPVAGQTIRVTGYGTTSAPISPTWNQVQKTHIGAYVSFLGSGIEYTVDTTDGNSGSPVIDETTGQVIGIHTNAGCEFGANSGTALNNPGLMAALANPQGVCNPCPPVTDCNANGIDDDCDLEAGSSPDCDGNGVPDECDTAGGSGDCNGNGVPDTCETEDLFVAESGPLSPFGGGKPGALVMAGAPDAVDTVTIYVVARGDFEATIEVAAVRLNGTNVATILQTGTFCAAVGEATIVPIDAMVWNDAILAGGGTVEVSVVPNGFVDAAACAGTSFVEITTFYTFVPPNDQNGNGVPDDCEIPGDLDGSGVVGFADLIIMLEAWGACPPAEACPSDLDGNGAVGFADLIIMLENWG